METILKVRVATEEKARFERAAKSVGQNLSEWVRESLNASADCDLEEGGNAPPNVLPKEPKKVAAVVSAKRAAAQPKPAVRPGTIDRDKIAAFQRKAGMGGAGKKR